MRLDVAKLVKRHRKKIVMCFAIFSGIIIILLGRLAFITIMESGRLTELADALHERERAIKAARGRIVSSDGTILATNETVCTISVVYSQVTDPETVISVLSEKLGMSEEKVRSYVEKRSSMERVATNVTKEIGDEIRELDLDGVKVDEDSKRYYPYSSLASKVLGFTGSDNQGIVGLEVEYEDYLSGTPGSILTITDAYGVEIDTEAETRVEPIAGADLTISLDYNIQKYAEQAAAKAYEAKGAKSVSIIVMNPQNGEIYAMVNYPEYNLNEPFTLNYELTSEVTEAEELELLNKMWRNGVINDTYEPGSTFKIVTATAALESGACSLSDSYTCGGSIHVADRTIRCAKVTGHGTQTFAQSLQNSCNPAFITWGLRVGIDRFYNYMDVLGILEKTGVDIPGEAGTIMHKKEDMTELNLATVAFGQSFQITPLQLLRAASCVINGGTLITPHFGVSAEYPDGTTEVLQYDTTENVISKETSETMKVLLESVVAEGGGSRCQIEGYNIGGKTATSQKLPRGSGKYISSFIGFAPADDPQVIAMCIIDEPQGVYYGGLVCAPVVKEIFENILPYLNIEKEN